MQAWVAVMLGVESKKCKRVVNVEYSPGNASGSSTVPFIFWCG